MQIDKGDAGARRVSRGVWHHADNFPTKHGALVGNLTSIVTDLVGLCHMPLVYFQLANSTVLVYMMAGEELRSGVYLRGVAGIPPFVGHIFCTQGVWHTMQPFPVDLRQLREEYPVMERPHLEWKWAIGKLQADLADKLLTTRTPCFYPLDELQVRERSSMALPGLRKVQSRTLGISPDDDLNEMDKLAQLTQEEQWALVLNSRP